MLITQCRPYMSFGLKFSETYTYVSINIIHIKLKKHVNYWTEIYIIHIHVFTWVIKVEVEVIKLLGFLNNITTNEIEIKFCITVFDFFWS